MGICRQILNVNLERIKKYIIGIQHKTRRTQDGRETKQQSVSGNPHVMKMIENGLEPNSIVSVLTL